MSDRAPNGLAAGGKFLWRSITDAHELDAAQLVQLTEACRAKDRLDRLDALLRGEVESWARLIVDEELGEATLIVNNALDKANVTANVMKQLLAALRLPDEVTGKRPQYRGARGAQKPTVPGVGAARNRLKAV